MAVDSRTHSGVVKLGRSGFSPRCRARMFWTAARPISNMGWRTVVSGGEQNAAKFSSSKPTTETSRGTSSPWRLRACSEAMAIWSLAANSAVKGRPLARKADAPACPLSGLKAPSNTSAGSKGRAAASSASR
jgi:hypothetical protein